MLSVKTRVMATLGIKKHTAKGMRDRERLIPNKQTNKTGFQKNHYKAKAG